MNEIKPLSHSRLNSYSYLCPFVYYLRYIAQKSASGTGLARVWGTAVHKAVHHYHTQPKYDEAMPDAQWLEELMDAKLAEGLEPISEELAILFMTMASIKPDYRALYAELSEQYKAPMQTKAWATHKTPADAKKLTEQVLTLVETLPDFKYSKSEGLFAKSLLHTKVAANYLAFDAKFPTFFADESGIFIEKDIVFSLPNVERPVRAIIDQVRIFPDDYETPELAGRPFVADLKTSLNTPSDEVTAHLAQGVIYQMAFLTTTSVMPAGAMFPHIRTEDLPLQPPVTQQQLDELVETIAMLARAEEYNVFPRRRDAKCSDCDDCAECNATPSIIKP